MSVTSNRTVRVTANVEYATSKISTGQAISSGMLMWGPVTINPALRRKRKRGIGGPPKYGHSLETTSEWSNPTPPVLFAQCVPFWLLGRSSDVLRPDGSLFEVDPRNAENVRYKTRLNEPEEVPLREIQKWSVFPTSDAARVFGVWDAETATTSDHHVAVAVDGVVSVNMHRQHSVLPGTAVGASRETGEVVPWTAGSTTVVRIGVVVGAPEFLGRLCSSATGALESLLMKVPILLQLHAPVAPERPQDFQDAYAKIVCTMAECTAAETAAFSKVLEAHKYHVSPYVLDGLKTALANPVCVQKRAESKADARAVILSLTAGNVDIEKCQEIVWLCNPTLGEDKQLALEGLIYAPLGWQATITNLMANTFDGQDKILLVTSTLNTWGLQK